MRDDRVLPVTRVVHAFLALVITPFCVLLTLHPADTAHNFAWPLTPTMSALLFASLYLTVIYSFGRVVFARRWHEVALVVWVTLPVLALLGTVTLCYWERFNRTQFPFYVWLVAYVILPPALAVILWCNRRHDPKVAARDDVLNPPWVGRVSAVLAGLFAVVAAGLLLAPEFMSTIWPWPIKPLSSRALGCLLVAPAVGHFVAAREPRWSALRIGTQAAIIWFVGIGVAVARAWPEFHHARPTTWLFLGVLALELLFSLATYRSLEAQRRRLAD